MNAERELDTTARGTVQRSWPIAGLALVALLATGLAGTANADRQLETEAAAVTWGTGLNADDTIYYGQSPASPLFDDSVSPWTATYLGPDHGTWAYADETGRTRTYGYTGTRQGMFPSSAYAETQLLWIGSFLRDDARNPTFTINRSWLYVFAQTRGGGFLLDKSGRVRAPLAYWAFQVRVTGSNPAATTIVFEHYARLEGIINDDRFPLELVYNRGRDLSSGTDAGNPFGDTTELVFDAGCIPTGQAPVCVNNEVGLRYEIPKTTRSIDLDAFGIEFGEEYRIDYVLAIRIGEDASEQYAEAVLGDPLDVDGGGLVLDTTHTPVASNLGYCDPAPDPNRYLRNGDGTVTDTQTGLMWQRCPVGHALDDQGTPDPEDDLCTAGPSAEYDWQAALQAAAADSGANFDDWRVPNVKELDSLVEPGCVLPTLDTRAFPDTPPQAFWSSTPSAADGKAWTVEFLRGDLLPSGRTAQAYLRLVRDSGSAPLVRTPALIAGTPSMDEGDSGTTLLSFPLVLSAPADGDVTVDYAVEPMSAGDGTDFTAVAGTATIPDGQRHAAVTVPIVGDTEPENDELLRLRLDNLIGNAYLATPTAVGTIVDDEPRADLLAVVPDLYEGAAGATGSAEFEVLLSAPAAAAVTVEYAAVGDDATLGSDFLAAAGSVTIAPGDVSATITVPIVGDDSVESDESFDVLLQNIVGGAKPGIDSATVTIIDDDAAEGYTALNDTGVTYCANAGSTLLACPQPGFPSQDGELGRDATANDDSDGLAGFAFTKLDDAGVPLADQSATYPFVNVPPNPTQARWHCVRDEVTGLTWEIKTDEPDALRHYDWTYSWYDASGATDGGDPGIANGGVCAAGMDCDTAAYVAAVNAANLCGFDDWRLPRADELYTIAAVASPTSASLRGLDSNYFPHNYSTSFSGNDGYTYWSATSYAGVAEWVWMQQFESGGADLRPSPKTAALPLRLVRGGQ